MDINCKETFSMGSRGTRLNDYIQSSYRYIWILPTIAKQGNPPELHRRLRTYNIKRPPGRSAQCMYSIILSWETSDNSPGVLRQAGEANDSYCSEIFL
jgi:hypothetical protein